MFARGETPVRKASVTKTAAIMGLGALCVAVAGCGNAAMPTSLFLNIEAETAANPPPDEMRIWVFGKFGAIFQDAPLPASGPLVLRNPTSFGTVTIYVPENTGHARLDVRTRIQGSTQLEGTVEIDVRPGQQVAVTVKLRGSSASDGDGDGDGDGVPDPTTTAARRPMPIRPMRTATGSATSAKLVSTEATTRPAMPRATRAPMLAPMKRPIRRPTRPHQLTRDWTRPRMS